MSLKFTLPDSYEFHERIYTRVVHGNFQKVANIVRKHRSHLSREWNPEEPQNSAVYETCLELEAWKEVQPEIFELQADTLTDCIVSLRATGGPCEVPDDNEAKRLCDGFTTALLSGNKADIRSATVKLHALLSARLRQEAPSRADTRRDLRTSSG